MQIAKNRAIFQAAGFQTLEARTPCEACDSFTYHHVDLLFTDLIMPGSDGIELYRKISAEHPTCIGILQTAYLNPRVRKEAQDSKFFACLPKTAKKSLVLSLIAHAFQILNPALN